MIFCTSPIILKFTQLVNSNVLFYTLKLCRKLYNWALSERERIYKETGNGLSYLTLELDIPNQKNITNKSVGIDMGLAKSIHDVGWGRFKAYIEYKSNHKGKILILVTLKEHHKPVCVAGTLRKT
ncbi:MAG: helix-turn-helix domain-containing protein [Desulfitobacterium hafniense]|nr:helix-turn-helix domain-containing protein [Desulfitobacterium hafniense]